MMEVFSVVPLSSLSDLPSGAVAGFRLMVPMSVVILPGIVVVAREQCPCSLGQEINIDIPGRSGGRKE